MGGPSQGHCEKSGVEKGLGLGGTVGRTEERGPSEPASAG